MDLCKQRDCYLLLFVFVYSKKFVNAGDPNPVIFFEPKGLYRAAVDEVPTGDYVIPLGKAEIVKQGEHITLVGWGAQVRVLEKVLKLL